MCYDAVMSNRTVTVAEDEYTGAVYVTVAKVGPGGVSRTVELDDGVFLDVDADGRILGIELLGWRLAPPTSHETPLIWPESASDE